MQTKCAHGNIVEFDLVPIDCECTEPHECGYLGCTATAVVAVIFRDDNPSFPVVCRAHANPETWQW
jgi:hypothetical protein